MPTKPSAMPLALVVLALSSFAIGTSEFVIVGLLPDVATDLAVSIPAAGWLVSGYALGVAIGAPIMAVLTSRLQRKTALLLLMSLFVIDNLLCALSPGYGLMMSARVVTALCHGAFFGIGSVMAATLAAPDRKASAIALMFTGLTLANVLGVPLGTALGQAAGWRTTFWAVTVIGVLALIGLARAIPTLRDQTPLDLKAEVGALRNGPIWLALGTTVLFSSAMFALFTYIAPLLQTLTGVSPSGVTWTLLLMGVGLTLGNVIGGRFADRKLVLTLAVAFVAMAVFSALFGLLAGNFYAAEALLFVWALFAFAAVPALQINVVTVSAGAPNLIATLNIGAFNVGNALGAWAGGTVIEQVGLPAVPWAAAALALLALLALAGKRMTSAPALSAATG